MNPIDQRGAGRIDRERLRVCWLTPDKPANISVGRARIADHLRDRGIDVVLRGTTPETVLGVLGDRAGFDAVIGTTRAGAIAGVLLSRAKRCPLIVDHVDPIAQFETTASPGAARAVRWLENRTFESAAAVLYVYPEERARVERFANRVERTHLGVEFDRFAAPDPASIERAVTDFERLEIDPEDRVAIYVGGLEPIYHIGALLESVRHLAGWRLVVIGDGSLGERVERASRTGSVSYLGTVPHETIPGYLRAADVGVCLVDDPHTLKVLEYGAAGLPVVQLAGRAEARFGDRVAYCGPDPTAIARTIETAFRATSNTATKPRVEALRTFASGFDWSEIALDYERVLRETTR